MFRTNRRQLVTAVVIAAAVGGFAWAQPPASESGFIQVEPDVRLFYQRFGTGRPTVFIPNRHELALPLAPLLYFHDVVLWDPRGRGLSDRPDDLGRYGIDVEIADAEKIREHFGASGITYVGISLWSVVALHYAAQHPEAVARVVGMGPFEPAVELGTGPGLVVERDTSDIEAAMAALEAEGLAESHQYCLLAKRHGWVSNLVNLERMVVGEALNLCQYANEYDHNILPVVFEGILGKWGEWDWRDVYATITQPVLLVWGDHEWSIEGIQVHFDIIENAHGIEIPGADHAVWLDTSDVVIPILDDFFRGRWPVGAR